MRRGASLIGLILLVILIVGGILFLIPYYQQFSDKVIIMQALHQTQDVVKVTPGISDYDIQSEFFSDLKVKKLSVKVYETDFKVVRHEGSTFILKCRYVKQNIKIPLLGIKLKNVDKYIGTKEFGL